MIMATSDITCNFCNNRYRDPKILPCIHVFCRDCIELLRVALRPGVIRCPECAKDVDLPPGGSEELPDALHVYHRMDLRRFTQKLRQQELNCGLCLANTRTEVDAVAFCQVCADHVCTNCADRHREEPEFSDHRLIWFDDLTRSANHGDCSPHQIVLRRRRAATFSTRFSLCSQHQKELNYYCYECSQLMCINCQKDTHKGHTYNHFSKSASDCRKKIDDCLPTVRVLHKRLAASVEDIKKRRTEIKAQSEHISESIDASFTRLFRILERRKEELKGQLSQMVEGKTSHLYMQQEKMKRGEEELGRLELFATENMESCTEQEMLVSFKFIHDRIKETVQLYSHTDVVPCERSNLAVKMSCAPHISDICQKHAKVYADEANPLTCEVEGSGLLNAETLRMARFNVHVCDKTRTPCKSQQDVSVTLKCLSNGISVPADVNERGKSVYLVSYCPQFRGLHEVSVLVNGKSVHGSPFTVRVSYPPSMLGKSQGIIDFVKAPRGITLSRNGGFFVAEWNGGKVMELDEHGRKARSYGEGLLLHPAGVAVDDSKNLYIVDSGGGEKNCLVKIGPSGKVLKTVGREGEGKLEFKNPRGITINEQNELHVCDRDNHRIQVFDTNLSLIRTLDLRMSNPHLSNTTKPNDLAFDSAGKMFIADHANNCILTFSASNSFLSFFGNSGDKQGELTGPECIHVSSGLVYVTEQGNHRVSVFQINGDFVTSFGSRGSGEDEMKFPAGITIDSSGIVYVCELFNNRIQLF